MGQLILIRNCGTLDSHLGWAGTADALSPYGVAARYPNEMYLESRHADQAVKWAETIYEWAKRSVELWYFCTNGDLFWRTREIDVQYRFENCCDVFNLPSVHLSPRVLLCGQYLLFYFQYGMTRIYRIPIISFLTHVSD